MLELNYYVAGQGPIIQHEVMYLHQAALISYLDDFSDPESGWDRHTEAKISVDYQEGAYRIWIDFANATYWFSAGQSFDDVTIESRATLQGGPAISRFGLMCHYAVAGGGMVQFLIDGRRRYGVLWQEQGELTYLGAEGMERSEAIQLAGEPNVLQAVSTGDTLSFWANGQELPSMENTVSSGSGDVGFVVDTTDGAGLVDLATVVAGHQLPKLIVTRSRGCIAAARCWAAWIST